MSAPDLDDLLALHLTRAHLIAAAEDLRQIRPCDLRHLDPDFAARLAEARRGLEALTVLTYRPARRPAGRGGP